MSEKNTLLFLYKSYLQFIKLLLNYLLNDHTMISQNYSFEFTALFTLFSFSVKHFKFINLNYQKNEGS